MIWKVVLGSKSEGLGTTEVDAVSNRGLIPRSLSEKHLKASSRRTETGLLTHGLLSLSVQDAQGVNSLVLTSCACAEGKGAPTRG